MKTTDFKKMDFSHYEIAKRIYENDGSDKVIRCGECPFSIGNSTNDKTCSENHYVDSGCANKPNRTLKQSAKEFIELYEKEGQSKIDQEKISKLELKLAIYQKMIKLYESGFSSYSICIKLLKKEMEEI